MGRVIPREPRTAVGKPFVAEAADELHSLRPTRVSPLPALPGTLRKAGRGLQKGSWKGASDSSALSDSAKGQARARGGSGRTRPAELQPGTGSYRGWVVPGGRGTGAWGGACSSELPGRPASLGASPAHTSSCTGPCESRGGPTGGCCGRVPDQAVARAGV